MNIDPKGNRMSGYHKGAVLRTSPTEERLSHREELWGDFLVASVFISWSWDEGQTAGMYGMSSKLLEVSVSRVKAGCGGEVHSSAGRSLMEAVPVFH